MLSKTKSGGGRQVEIVVHETTQKRRSALPRRRSARVSPEIGTNRCRVALRQGFEQIGSLDE